MIKVGLPSVARHDARVLILGSLPGDASLAAAQYYAHPRNHFWPLMGEVVGHDLAVMDYATRLDVLQSAGVALWDVVATAARKGSLDASIVGAQVNDLKAFATSLSNLRAIAFNGRKAAILARNAFEGMPIDILHLPSSSPAFTLDAASKADAWSALRRYLL